MSVKICCCTPFEFMKLGAAQQDKRRYLLTSMLIVSVLFKKVKGKSYDFTKDLQPARKVDKINGKGVRKYKQSLLQPGIEGQGATYICQSKRKDGLP